MTVGIPIKNYVTKVRRPLSSVTKLAVVGRFICTISYKEIIFSVIFECNTDKMTIGDTIFFIISFFFRLEKHTEYRSVAQYFENRGIWGKVQGVRPPL